MADESFLSTGSNDYAVGREVKRPRGLYSPVQTPVSKEEFINRRFLAPAERKAARAFNKAIEVGETAKKYPQQSTDDLRNAIEKLIFNTSLSDDAYHKAVRDLYMKNALAKKMAKTKDKYDKIADEKDRLVQQIQDVIDGKGSSLEIESAYNDYLQQPKFSKELRERKLAAQRLAEQRKKEKAASKQERYKKRGDRQAKVFAWADKSPWDPDYASNRRMSLEDRYKKNKGDYSKVTKPDMKTITDSLGNKHEVIDSKLGVPLGFNEEHGFHGYNNEEDIYKIKGIDRDVDLFGSSFGDAVTESRGCGHIKHLKYNEKLMLLQVTFATGGAVVNYIDVPPVVAGELIHFAENGATNAEGKHLLGTRFWDLVRIRGTKHGSVYEYVYSEENSYEYSSVAAENAASDRADEAYDALEAYTEPSGLDKRSQFERDVSRMGSQEKWTPGFIKAIGEVLDDKNHKGYTDIEIVNRLRRHGAII